MAESSTISTIVLLAITSFSTLAGVVINAGINYINEVRRGEREAVRVNLEKEIRDLELRDEAYTKFLSITKKQAHDTDEYEDELFNPEIVEDIVALVFMKGSPEVSSIIQTSYPFRSWTALENVKKSIMKEILNEKGEEYIDPTVPRLPPRLRKFRRL
jgi:hypothetical protein